MNGITNVIGRNYAHAEEVTNSKTVANQNKMENTKNAAKNERSCLMFLELTDLIKK